MWLLKCSCAFVWQSTGCATLYFNLSSWQTILTSKTLNWHISHVASEVQLCLWQSTGCAPLYFNPFTAMLSAPSLRKWPVKVQIWNHFGVSSLSHKHIKGFLSKCTVLKVDLISDQQIYCFQACICTLFSLEILQAGAVKGLICCFDNVDL